MRSIGARLERLETMRPAHIILEITIDGKPTRLTARQFAESGHDFLQARIVEGNDLGDAKRLLDTFPSCID